MAYKPVGADENGNFPPRVKAKLDATFATLDTNGKQPVRKGELVFNVKDYGALGNGVADDRASIQSALTAAGAAGGGVVFIPAGNYKISSSPELNIPAKVSVQGAGSGAVTITQANWSSPSLFKAVGAFGATVNLTADVAAGANVLNISSTSGIAKGDLLLIGSNEAVPGGVIPTDGYRGEYVRIKAVGSGTQLTIWGRTGNSYAVSASAGVKPTKAFLSGVKVSGLTIVNPEPDQHDNGFLYFTQCLDVTVTDVVGRGCDSTGVQFMNVYGATVDNLHLYDQPDRVDVEPKRFGYGIATYAAVEHLTVTNSHFTRMRHGFTTSGYQSVWGQTRNVTVTGTATETTNAAFDTHPGAVAVNFVGCTVTNTTGAAFQLRGIGNTVNAATVDNCTTGVFITSNAHGSKVKNSSFRNLGGWSTQGGTQTEYPADPNGGGYGVELRGVTNVTVSGNEFENLSRAGIYMDGQGSATVARVYITGNKFVNLGRSGSTRYGVYMVNTITTLSDVVINNNLFGAHASASAEVNSTGAIDDLFRIEVAPAGITKTFLYRNLIYGLGSGMVAGAGASSTGIVERNNRIMDVAAELESFGNMFMKGYIKFDESQNIVFGSTVGTKIGTASTQKLAFYGTNPITRPGGVPIAATDLASTQALANYLRTQLMNLGLIG